MATRWLYETATGVNFCVGMTSDDGNTAPDWLEHRPDDWQTTYTADDPAIEPPATQNLVPLKRYNIAQNKIFQCTAAQIQAYNLREAKHRKRLQIDEKLSRLFGRGLQYDGRRLPLDIDDSFNYFLLYTQRDNNDIYPTQGQTYAPPITLITRATNAAGNMESYTISSPSDAKAFGEAAIARIRLLVDGARDLKLQVAAATTVAEVNAVDVRGWNP